MKVHISKKIGTALILLAVIVLILTVSFLFFQPKIRSVNPQIGASTGKNALESMKAICGESYIETLASLKDAKKQDDPEEFLVENSIYIMDEDAMEKYTETYIAGAETTARSNGISMEQLVINEWGYESIADYKSQARSEAQTFVKQRLAIYEAAKKMHIQIKPKEYAKLLSTYAELFGYHTTEEFTYACIPSSIANEMLYDKTLSRLRD